MTLTMKRMPIGFTLGVFLLCTGQVTTIRAGEQPKQFVLISIDVPGYPSLAPQGINDSGDIAGQIIDAQGVIRHGFLMRPGEAAVSIDHPGAGAGGVTAATGINAQGDIVGWYRLPGEASDPLAAHGYLLSRKGRFTAIDYPGHLNTLPQRITSTGTILGCYHDLDNMDSMHGFTKSADGSFTGFPSSPSMSNGATPDASRIVGKYETHSFVIDRGDFLSFDVPDSTLTSAYDVNPQGEIVGHFQDSSGRFHGFFRDED